MNNRLATGAAVGLAVVLVVAPQFAFRGRVFPRVEAGRWPVGGQTLAQAERTLAEARSEAGTTSITIRDPRTTATWIHTAAELGLSLDPNATAERALAFGRTGLVGRLVSPWTALALGADVVPVWYVADPASPALQAITDEVSSPPANASLEEVDGRVVALPSSIGQAVDTDATVAALLEELALGSGEPVDLRFVPTGARIGSLEDVATTWEVIRSSPLAITWEGATLDRIEVNELERWFHLEDRPNAERDVVPTIVVDTAAVTARMVALAPMVQRSPRDARFSLDPGTVRALVIDPGQTGAALDLNRSVERVIAGAYGRQRVAEVVATTTPARLAPEDVQSLHGAVLLAEAWTPLGSSPAGRVQNIQAAALALQGLAMAPGHEVSLLDALGEVAPETGFHLAYLRPQPTLAPGWTGGLEQVATGYFRAAFWGGLAVFERHAPPVRVGWLEPPVGMDAAIQAPDTDLRLANATTSHLLFLNEVDNRRNAFGVRLYAQPDLEPQVLLAGPAVSEVTSAAEPESRQDATLPSGSRLPVGWSREGATVRVDRSVTIPGGPTFSDVFESVYAPAADVTALGPR